MLSRQTGFIDAGLIEYEKAWKLQEDLFSEVVGRKIQNRNLPPQDQILQRHYLIFCEHPHVFTIGRSGDDKNLLADAQKLKEINAGFFHNNRGGDITYHGPGQLVGYPILDLDHFFTDIHKYLRLLEEAVILTLAEYSVVAGRIAGCTGVWIDHDKGPLARKICALGVRCSRWVTMHGFAFNVNTDLSLFRNIIPCGITDKGVTSLEVETGKKADMEEVKLKLKNHLQRLFSMDLTDSALIRS